MSSHAARAMATMARIRPSLTAVLIAGVMVLAAQAQEGAGGGPSGRPVWPSDFPPDPIFGQRGVDVGLGGTNEPAIAINPLNRLNIAAASLFSSRVSINGGATWTAALNSPIPGGTIRQGDSTLAFDSRGRLFWAYLVGNAAGSTADVYVCQLNPVTGAVLAGPFQVSTTAAAGAFNDKEWLAADAWPTSPFRDRLYMCWTEFSAAGARTVYTSFSTNQGVTWSAALAVSVAAEGFPWPAHNAVAPNGNVFVAYHSQVAFNGVGELGGNPTGTSGKIMLVRSTNGGVSYPTKTQPYTAGQADITYNVQTSPGTIPMTRFWMQGSGQAWVLPDPHVAGRLFVVANDDPDNMHGAGDDATVYCVRSNDNGLTWGPRVQVDDGPGTSFQVFPTAWIDRVTGCISVMYYDNRLGGLNGAGNWVLNVFYTVSNNHGASFAPSVRINDVAFDPELGAPTRVPGPPATRRIGEYIGVANVDGDLSGVWCGNLGGGQQTVFDRVLAQCPGCPGDVDHDGDVDQDDLDIILFNFGTAVFPFTGGDLDGDGDVDQDDMDLVLFNFAAICP